MTDTQRADTLKRTAKTFLFVFIGLSLIGGCAGLAARSRLDQFKSTHRAYEWALESGNYRDAANYIDPSTVKESVDIERYANIKVSQYTIAKAKVSDDRLSIEQDVELHYFLLDQSVVKTTMDHQVWRYREPEDEWMLQTGLPVFPQ